MTAKILYNKRSFRLVLGLAIAPVLFIATTAKAELITYFSNALSGWSGTTTFSSAGKLFVDVEYAVYAPGSFDANFPGKDPSDNNQYVYAYQLINNATSTDNIQKITLGLDSLALPANISEIDDPNLPSGTVSNPSFTGSPPGSAAWTYTTDVNVQPGGKSKILIFTSPNGPKLASSTMRGFAVGVIGNVPGGLPSPVPEPAALLGLVTVGCVFVLVRQFRRKSL